MILIISIFHLCLVDVGETQGDRRNQKAIFQPFGKKTGVFPAFFG